MTRKWLALAGFGVAVAAAALVGVLGVTGTRAEYQSLGQPPWAPPSWLFGPVSRVAAGLLLPYWAWVTFATALNAWIWANN